MVNKRKPLSPAQQVRLNAVRDGFDGFKRSKADTEARVRAQVKEENARAELELAIAVRKAREIGVPVSTIGRLGMKTTDRSTVHRWLKKTERVELTNSPADTPIGVFSWSDPDRGAVTVRYEGFPTRVTDESYPETLEGVAVRDESATNGWSVDSDPGTVETELGPLKGWFSFEIEETPAGQEGSLIEQLNAWVKVNR